MAVKLDGSRPQPAAQPAQDGGLESVSFGANRDLGNAVGAVQTLSEVLYRFVNTSLGTNTPFQASESISQRLSADGEGPGMAGDRVLAVAGMLRFAGGGGIMIQSQPTEAEVRSPADESVSTVLVLGRQGGSRIAA